VLGNIGYLLICGLLYLFMVRREVRVCVCGCLLFVLVCGTGSCPGCGSEFLNF
jgi:hypothetical protein